MRGITDITIACAAALSLTTATADAQRFGSPESGKWLSESYSFGSEDLGGSVRVAAGAGRGQVPLVRFGCLLLGARPSGREAFAEAASTMRLLGRSKTAFRAEMDAAAMGASRYRLDLGFFRLDFRTPARNDARAYIRAGWRTLTDRKSATRISSPVVSLGSYTIAKLTVAYPIVGPLKIKVRAKASIGGRAGGTIALGNNPKATLDASGGPSATVSASLGGSIGGLGVEGGLRARAKFATLRANGSVELAGSAPRGTFKATVTAIDIALEIYGKVSYWIGSSSDSETLARWRRGKFTLVNRRF